MFVCLFVGMDVSRRVRCVFVFMWMWMCVPLFVCVCVNLCVCPRVCACARACAVCVYIHTLIHKHVSNTQFLFLSVSCPNERPRSLTQPQAKPVFSYPHRGKTRTHSHNTLPNAQILFSCVFH